LKEWVIPVLRIRIRNPVPFVTPGSGVKILKFFDSDPGWKEFGSGIRDGKNSDPGSGMERIRVRDGKTGIRDPG
jgi:hypothetical protein